MISVICTYVHIEFKITLATVLVFYLLHVMPIFVVYILHQSTCTGSLVFVLARTIVAN